MVLREARGGEEEQQRECDEAGRKDDLLDADTLYRHARIPVGGVCSRQPYSVGEVGVLFGLPQQTGF